MTIQKRNKQVENLSTEFQDTRQCSISEIEESSLGNIKVTIKDRQDYESEENRLCVLKSCFGALRENARSKQRLREIKINIQSIAIHRNLKRCIRVWRMHVENAKKVRQEHAMKNSNVYKIEMFVDTIAEMQKDLTKYQKADLKVSSATNGKGIEMRKRILTRPFVIESPAQSRLNVQKEIIHKQRIKLAEQTKIIEELKLKQIQEEITRSDKETMDAAKETLTHCGQQTRRTLIQLMRQAGYRSRNYKFPKNPEETKKLTRHKSFVSRCTNTTFQMKFSLLSTF